MQQYKSANKSDMLIKYILMLRQVGTWSMNVQHKEKLAKMEMNAIRWTCLKKNKI